MIVPLGNGGDTRLSVPVPARAVTPSGTLSVPASAAWPLPPGTVGKPPSRAIIALRNKERSARLRKGQVVPAAAFSSRQDPSFGSPVSRVLSPFSFFRHQTITFDDLTIHSTCII